MAICAGVQKLSRPIDWCHEISQWVPTIANVTAATEHHTYQGTFSCVAEFRSDTAFPVLNARSIPQDRSTSACWCYGLVLRLGHGPLSDRARASSTRLTRNPHHPHRLPGNPVVFLTYHRLVRDRGGVVEGTRPVQHLVEHVVLQF